MAGFLVLEASNLAEAVRRLEQQPVDAVVVSLDLPPEGSPSLLAALHRRPEWECIPVLALADTPAQARKMAKKKTGFYDCQAKSDQELVLEAVARMVAPPASFDAELVCAGEEK